MRLNLKKDFLLVTTMLVAVGCSDSMTEESDSEQRIPIVFGTQVATRAVVENNKEGMDNFTVWGWVRESDGPKLFFDAVPVTPSGNYGEKRFWAVGRPYGFYAVHPEKMKENNIATEVSCNDKGELRVTGFDSSEMGKGAVDLMTAAKTDVVYEGGGMMAPVLLAFKHELAQVKFTVCTGEKQAEVSDIRLLGVDYKGDLLWTPEESTWQNRINCTEEGTPFVRSESVRIEAGSSVTVLDSVLLLPQPVTEHVAVTFKYAYAGKPLSEAKEAMVYLDVAQTTEWIKSSTYHYKITLPAGDADITVKVSVGDWDSRDISADW